ncbi:MAG: hypothetical protein HFH41_08550 [Lachnospiraceae bacterium]|nr:hypothetical protein [Lachnospiraceae bacterium]
MKGKNDVEAISIARLYGWESEIIHARSKNQSIDHLSKELIENPSYGDGGMASAVRIVSSGSMKKES